MDFIIYFKKDYSLLNRFHANKNSGSSGNMHFETTVPVFFCRCNSRTRIICSDVSYYTCCQISNCNWCLIVGIIVFVIPICSKNTGRFKCAIGCKIQFDFAFGVFETLTPVVQHIEWAFL